MGCDIHLYVERKVPGIGWVSLEDPNEHYNGLTNRNYSIFAILANVRNGRGFAGIVTGTGFNPISEPRGLGLEQYMAMIVLPFKMKKLD